MFKDSEKLQVLRFIKSQFPQSVAGIDLESWALVDRKMKAETAARRARELARENYIERMPGKYAVYRYKQQEPKTLFSREEEVKRLLVG